MSIEYIFPCTLLYIFWDLVLTADGIIFECFLFLKFEVSVYISCDNGYWSKLSDIMVKCFKLCVKEKKNPLVKLVKIKRSNMFSISASYAIKKKRLPFEITPHTLHTLLLKTEREMQDKLNKNKTLTFTKLLQRSSCYNEIRAVLIKILVNDLMLKTCQ